MGLKKQDILRTGVSGDYWMINMIQVDKILKQVTVWLMLYKDAEFRTTAGAQSLRSVNFTFPKSDFSDLVDEVTKDTQISKVYAKLKTLPEFKDAIDV